MKKTSHVKQLETAIDAALPHLPAEIAAQLRSAFTSLLDPSADWIRHTEAAHLLKRNADLLAQKRDGEYVLYPELTRIRRENEKFIWMLRSEVVELIERTTQAAVHRNKAQNATPTSEQVRRYGSRTAAILARMG